MADGSKCCPDAAGLSGQCLKDRYHASKKPTSRKLSIPQKRNRHEGKKPSPRVKTLRRKKFHPAEGKVRTQNGELCPQISPVQ